MRVVVDELLNSTICTEFVRAEEDQEVSGGGGGDGLLNYVFLFCFAAWPLFGASRHSSDGYARRERP